MPTKIRIENVTKIFGETPDQEPLSLLQSGISKDEILQRTGHVVGLADVSLTVDEGEIFVVMGLSGSGKSTLIRTVNRLIAVPKCLWSSNILASFPTERSSKM